ncbi:MAG TPA: phage portal protein, partial [Desulfobacterales bacterium]|nr:phage portal protein [Desulfobacterales bacterium]
TATGISVNSDSAMRSMTVHSCVKILANSAKLCPCRLMREIGKMKEKAKDHYLYSILHDQPNEWMTAPEFWGMCSAHLDMRGNFYALKTGFPNEQIRELIPLQADAVQEVEQLPNYKLNYKVRRPDKNGSGKVDDIPGERIMHIRGLVWNGYMGMNPIEYSRESIGLALATEKHGAKLFSNAARIGGILTMPGKFKTKKDAEDYLKSFNEVYGAVENAHKTAMLEHGITFTPMTMKSDDAQFLETRNFQKKEIVDLFIGLPLSMLQSGDKTATYASAEQFSLSYVIYALMPRFISIEKAIRRDLLTEEEKKEYYAKFSVQGLLRGDIKTRFEAYAKAIDKEIMNPNEIRDLEDLNPYEGGDEFRTRTSTVKETKEPEEEE